ncbi:hypothetical protein ANN_25673 [Periplaneta americana]|uniref:Uncharacterized protein n=1 Tax=Periplaneta americana TaxID=6978 RepID=A0ABQ8S448_PERAM|nr:hypothetical protein ANN_25673 [Periplaneta americana]
MAGLCEGGNEPPGCLKAREEARCRCEAKEPPSYRTDIEWKWGGGGHNRGHQNIRYIQTQIRSHEEEEAVHGVSLSAELPGATSDHHVVRNRPSPAQTTGRDDAVCHIARFEPTRGRGFTWAELNNVSKLFTIKTIHVY